MMVTKAASWLKKATLEPLTLHIMSRGMKSVRASTAAGNSLLCLDGCRKTRVQRFHSSNT